MKKYCLKTLLAIISFAVIFAASSCTKYFESYNTDKTNPPREELPPGELLGLGFSNLIEAMHMIHQNRSQHVEQMVGNQYGGYFATTARWNGTNFGTFNPSLEWVEQPFVLTMTRLNASYAEVVDITQKKGYIYAWANVMRVYAMLRMTDTYGPIPYSKVGVEDNGQTPYDDVPDLYRTMINQLSSSIHELNLFMQSSSTGIADDFVDVDVIYKGNMGKWLKLATSLKLRLAVRIAHIDTDFAQTAIRDAAAGDLLLSNNDNAFTNEITKNAYHLASYSWGELSISATLSTYMNAFNDPRRPAYMTAANGVYRGVRTGINNINQATYSNANNFSKPNVTETTPLSIFCAAETAFLLAEAALEGWIPGGDAVAKTYYEQGITLSMEQWGVSIGTYLTGTASPSDTGNGYVDHIASANSISVPNKITVSWNNYGTTSNTKLEKIITQKWLANYTIGYESWSEFRRTGFPQIFPPATNLSSAAFMGSVDDSWGRLVRRLPFPISQITANPDNVAIARGMLGGPDEASTDLWWAKKN